MHSPLKVRHEIKRVNKGIYNVMCKNQLIYRLYAFKDAIIQKIAGFLRF